MQTARTLGIQVLSVGDTTVAEVTLPGNEGSGPTLRGKGIARKHPEDRRNKAIGEQLAVARAVEALSRKLDRQAQGAITHQENLRKAQARREAEPAPGRRGAARVAIRDV